MLTLLAGFLYNFHTHASTFTTGQLVAKVEQVLKCTNPIRKCELALSYECISGQKKCDGVTSDKKVNVTQIVKAPKVGDRFLVNWESVCNLTPNKSVSCQIPEFKVAESPTSDRSKECVPSFSCKQKWEFQKNLPSPTKN